MNPIRPITAWMEQCGLDLPALIEKSGLDPKVVEAIVAGRYTPSPQQRARIARVLGVDADQVTWGHTEAVDPMYGHGPQFGRSP
jgi:hypothetical protein